MRERVFVFLTRKCKNCLELLVFEHDQEFQDGIQTPGGGIEPDETPDCAAIRELYEETGIRGATIRKCIVVEEVPEWEVMAHVYHLNAPDGLPDKWSWQTNDYHNEEHRAKGNPLVYHYSWVPLSRKGFLRSEREQRWIDLILE